MQTITKQEAARELIDRRKARESFMDFIRYTMPTYEPNWHHEVAVDHLERFMFGDLDRLMVFMPPRHGKSELVSRRMPAYLFGKNPNAQIIATSYSSDLARRMNRDVQRIIDAQPYLNLFPKTKINTKNIKTMTTWLRNSDLFEIVDNKGIYTCCGIGGGITGMGADYAIVDDPIKNYKEAYSKTVRNSIWDWYNSVLSTRLEKKNKILLTLTRWHVDDLAGRLLKEQPGTWTVLRFPALRDSRSNGTDIRGENEALWPDRFNEERLMGIKKTSSQIWNSLYQQSPTEEKGAIIKRGWWQYYNTIPRFKEGLIQSWDTAFKDNESNDYNVCTTWLESENGYYLIDRFREKMQFPELLEAAKRLYEKHQPQAVYVEDKASGQSLIQVLQRETKIPVIAVPVESDKVVRLNAVSPVIQSGNVYLPERAEWLQDFIEEICSFPSVEHDDQVDSMTMALSQLSGNVIWTGDIGVGQTESSGYEVYAT
jgi:predicted phage terminase large subunit-like protein